MNQTFPQEKDLPDEWVCQYSEYDSEDGSWRALFEYPEYSLTTVVLPPSLPAVDQGRHVIINIYPLYEDIGLPKPYCTISLGDEYLREMLPDHNPKHPVSSRRSTLGGFDWDNYPEEYKNSSSYYRNYPLQYKEVFEDHQVWSEVVNLMDQFPQCFDDRTVTTEVYLNKGRENDLFIHTDLHIPDHLRESICKAFDLPDGEMYELEEKRQIGSVELIFPDADDSVAGFMYSEPSDAIGEFTVQKKYKNLVNPANLED